jgi:hypothetical protein
MYSTCILRKGFDQSFTRHCHTFTVITAIFHKLLNNKNIQDPEIINNILNCVLNKVSNRCSANSQSQLIDGYIRQLNKLNSDNIKKTIYANCDNDIQTYIINMVKNVIISRVRTLKNDDTLKQLILEINITRDLIPVSINVNDSFYCICSQIYENLKSGQVDITEQITPKFDNNQLEVHSILVFGIQSVKDIHFVLFSSSTYYRFGALELNLLLSHINDFDYIQLLDDKREPIINKHNFEHITDDTILDLPYLKRANFIHPEHELNYCNWSERKEFNQTVYMCIEIPSYAILYRTIDDPRTPSSDIRIENVKTNRINAYNTITGEENFSKTLFSFINNNLLTNTQMTPKFPVEFSELSQVVWVPTGDTYTYDKYVLTKLPNGVMILKDIQTNVKVYFNILSGIRYKEDKRGVEDINIQTDSKRGRIGVGGRKRTMQKHKCKNKKIKRSLKHRKS